MKRENRGFFPPFVLLIAVLSALPSDTSGQTNVPLRAYSGDIDEDQVVEMPQGEGYPALRFPVNQLLLFAAKRVGHRTMTDLIAGLPDTDLIGQVPGIGLYQVRIDSATVASLEQSMAALKALPQIEVAGPNLIGSYRTDVGACPVCPDVCDLPADDLLPYEQVDFPIALEIIKHLEDRSLIHLHPVTVGLVENGYGGAAEFEDTHIENVSQWATGTGRPLPLDADDPHGTAVAGIIAADNDGRGVNGLASTLLGDRLRVVMAKPLNNTVFAAIAAIKNLVHLGGTDIVSYTGPFPPPVLDPCNNVHLRATVESWKRFLAVHPNVLFVEAAANERWVYRLHDCGYGVTMPNMVPEGINLPNTLLVTASSHDDARQRVIRAGLGSAVEISAPGENLAVVGVDGAIAHKSGTSLSAPMVVSAAAMLKSIGGPDMSPARIKDLLLDAENCCDPTHPEGGVQLSFAYPLVDLLWEEYGNTDWGTALLGGAIVGPRDVGPVLPWVVAGRICEGAAVNVEHLGEYFFELGQHRLCDSQLSALLTADGRWSIMSAHLYAGNGSFLQLVAMLTTPLPFSLDQPYSFSDISLAATDGRHVNRSTCDYTQPRVGWWNAEAFEGQFTVRFTGCRVIERTSDGTPLVLSVDIELDAPRLSGRRVTRTEEGFDTEETEFGTVHGSLRNVVTNSETPFSEDIDAVCSGRQDENW